MSMRNLLVLLTLAALCSSAAAGLITQVDYELLDLSNGRWQYNYQITNLSLDAPITEASFLFDGGLYANLEVASQNIPSGWNESADVQPNIGPPEWEGLYAVWTEGQGIGPGQTSRWYSVSFDWIGAGEPGAQEYEVYDANFTELDKGITQLIPEPTALFLLVSGSVVFFRRRKNKRN